MRETEAMIQALRARGFRITKLRRGLVEIFLSQERPLSAFELNTFVQRASLAVNRSSIYREIEFFLREGLLLEVDVLDGTKRYEWRAEGEDHHHHLVCTRCRSVSCVHICFDIATVSKGIRKSVGFIIENHVLEFFGVCQKCQR